MIKTKVLLFSLAAALMASCSPKQESMDKVRDRVFDVATRQLVAMDKNLPEGRMPRTFDSEGKLVTSDIGWWCSGFYPGSLWIVYGHNGSEEVRTLAEKYTRRIEPLLEMHTDHDIGFQVNCSYGHAFDATGDEAYLPMIKASAERLASRFSPVTGTIRSWDFNSRWKYPVIIDNMMNLELLMRGAKQFGEDSLSETAIAHAVTTMENHFRDDYSSYHVVDYDPEDGHVVRRQTHQGYSDESAWSRGQAWGLYGYTMMYKFSGKQEFLDQAEHIAEYILGRLPEDAVPYWDYDAPDIPGAKRDASAGAIDASAMLDLASLTTNRDLAKRLRETAEKTLRTLASPEYLAEPGTNGNFVLKHSVGSIPGNSEVDVPLTYADYYFLEALSKF